MRRVRRTVTAIGMGMLLLSTGSGSTPGIDAAPAAVVAAAPRAQALLSCPRDSYQEMIFDYDATARETRSADQIVTGFLQAAERSDLLTAPRETVSSGPASRVVVVQPAAGATGVVFSLAPLPAGGLGLTEVLTCWDGPQAP